MKKSLLVILGTLFSLSLSACSGAGDSGESISPSLNPSIAPSVEPSVEPSLTPSVTPSVEPSQEPTSHGSEDFPSECGCDRISGAPGDEIYLEKDLNSNYVYDDVSNTNGGVGYELFVRSFYDTNNDGIGDLKGVAYKIPYLADLGIKTLWLMPIHPSPTYHGYDVLDYYDVSSDYGTMADFDELVTKANEYNIDIMLDMVFNHSSVEHPWFKQSYLDFKNNNESEDSKKDWYNWSTKSKGGYNPYYKDPSCSYESRFSSSMPDFNLKNEKVKSEIENIIKFWIEHGVKGFRLDAVLYYFYNNTTKNVEFLTWLEETAHKYNPDFYMVGEEWSPAGTVLGYHASKCDSFFNFDASMQSVGGLDNWQTINDAVQYRKTSVNFGNKWANAIENYESKVKKQNFDAYSTYFLTNHDGNRASDYFSGCQAKAAASLYFLLPGMSFMYYGEEISMLGKRVEKPIDDQSDVRRRLPMVWNKEDKTGECTFPEKSRPDLDNNTQVEYGADDLIQVPYSLINHYKKVINVRNKYPFLKHGIFENLTLSLEREDNCFLIAYKISLGDDYIIVVHNFNPYNVEVTALGDEILDEINTSQRKPYVREGKLGIGAYSTVVLR